MKSFLKRSKDAKNDLTNIIFLYGYIAVFFLMFLVARKLFKAGPEYKFDFGVVAASIAFNGYLLSNIFI